MLYRQLKVIRKQNGLSQQQLADVLGVSRSAYCGYETGRRTPDFSSIVKLSEFYKLPLENFIGKSSAEFVFDEQYENQNDTQYLSQLSREERELICKYRCLSTEMQSEIVELLKEKTKKQ